MKKILTALALAAATAATIIVVKMNKKKNEENMIIELDEEDSELIEEDVADSRYPYCGKNQILTLQNQCKLAMEPFTGKEIVTLRHYCDFASQEALFESVKQAKLLDYQLEEVNGNRSVILMKTIENYFDDIFTNICEIANGVQKNKGTYQGFKLD